jgi:pimeloyl-ACP methyl ester carboxylesterase
VHGWGQGRNLGPHSGVEQGMVDLRKKLTDDSGRKVSIAGWSLGGIYARELAACRPQEVRAIVTLGSPSVGDTRAANARRLYEAVSGHEADRADGRRARIEPPPPVPAMSIHSRTPTALSRGRPAWRKRGRSRRVSTWWPVTSACVFTRRCCMRWPTGWRSPKAAGNLFSAAP